MDGCLPDFLIRTPDSYYLYPIAAVKKTTEKRYLVKKNTPSAQGGGEKIKTTTNACQIKTLLLLCALARMYI